MILTGSFTSVEIITAKMRTIVKNILPPLLISLPLTGCGLEDGFTGASNARQTTANPESGELSGVLLIPAPDQCLLAEGYGLMYSLLGGNLKSRTALEGDFLAEQPQPYVQLAYAGDTGELPNAISGPPTITLSPVLPISIIPAA